jgi:hypothetical protein
LVLDHSFKKCDTQNNDKMTLGILPLSTTTLGVTKSITALSLTKNVTLSITSPSITAIGTMTLSIKTHSLTKK